MLIVVVVVVIVVVIPFLAIRFAWDSTVAKVCGNLTQLGSFICKPPTGIKCAEMNSEQTRLGIKIVKR